MSVGERHVSDETLVCAIGSGDHEALAMLADRYEPTLVGLASGLVGKHAAEDAVQDAWVRVLRYARSYKGNGTGKAWLYRIVVNCCRTAHRKQKSPKQLIRNAAEERTGDNGALHAALQQLDDRSREIVLLCYHRGMTHTLAAEVLRIPVGTVKSRLNAALTRLRATLNPTPDRPAPGKEGTP